MTTTMTTLTNNCKDSDNYNHNHHHHNNNCNYNDMTKKCNYNCANTNTYHHNYNCKYKSRYNCNNKCNCKYECEFKRNDCFCCSCSDSCLAVLLVVEDNGHLEGMLGRPRTDAKGTVAPQRHTVVTEFAIADKCWVCSPTDL